MKKSITVPKKSPSSSVQRKKPLGVYVNLVFNRPLHKSFTYKVSPEHQEKVPFGHRVIAPFGRSEQFIMGYVVEVLQQKPNFKCKEIKEFCDDSPIFDHKTLELAQWLSEYYLCSLGEALAVCIPKATQEKPLPLKKIQYLDYLPLNQEQKEAVDCITRSIHQQQFYPYLLFGVTGSGKTEVYKYLAQEAVKLGRQALVLVPEIALTPQTIRRFQSSFGDKIAVLHSKLNPKERYANWKLIHRGEVDIILGARSAVFSPNKRLGIIIIDEEHEQTYKSGDTPRYHARQVAYKIAKLKGIPLVLGSATPSLETLYHSEQKSITLLPLVERHSTHQKQDIVLVDMTKEKSKSFISRILFDKIANCLCRKEQIMIFLNKRGYSPLLICTSCGHTLKCPHCDISLTYHQDKKQMLCHYCGHAHPIITFCPSCDSKHVSLKGYGTERIEEELKESFVSARISRMDMDSTRKKGAHERILNDFKDGSIDILIGTQMIAKGLHFPNVTLVGVVLADLSLHIPDFRSSERTFSLLTQISGRAGRGEKQGDVVIQTYLPDNYVIQSAQSQDYYAFYQRELEERRKFAYPPFSRLIKLLVRGKNEDKVILETNNLFRLIRSSLTKSIDILGPAPAPLSKINNNYRWQMILKGDQIKPLQSIARLAQESFSKEKSLYLEIDVDPLSMM